MLDNRSASYVPCKVKKNQLMDSGTATATATTNVLFLCNLSAHTRQNGH